MFPRSFQKLIDQFSALPGIGPKMAERLVLHLFKQDPTYIDGFITDLSNITQIATCTQCFNIAEGDLCVICADTHRDRTRLCIVEEALDIVPIERSRAFDGVYHVLGGTIKKQKIDHLTLTQLSKRITDGHFTEILIATNLTTEGDMTAMHLKKMLAGTNAHISRIARGLATGSDIEYADDMTIRSAILNRERMS
jgi:recombination protein RecR